MLHCDTIFSTIKKKVKRNRFIIHHFAYDVQSVLTFHEKTKLHDFFSKNKCNLLAREYWCELEIVGWEIYVLVI